ncbi:MAG: universal stress protein [Caldimonas sp.]
MYKKILVPVDGSPTSLRGLDEAMALAHLTKAQIRLIHVVDEMSFALGASAGMSYSGEFFDVLRNAGAEILSAAQARVRKSGLEVDTVLNDSMAGRVSDLVMAQVVEWGAELIVLGTHGRRGVGRLVMGSDAENIIRAATIPVLLVRSATLAT